MMDSRKVVVCLLLSIPITRALPFSGFLSTTYTLFTGMQTIQSVSIGQIASLLGVPSREFKIPSKSLALNTLMREALDNSCRMRAKVAEIMALLSETPDDLELRILLTLTEQLRGDSYDWLAVKAGINSSTCSEEIMAEVCLQWEALRLSEKAEKSLHQLRLTIDDLHKKQITSVTLSEIIRGYFSS